MSVIIDPGFLPLALKRAATLACDCLGATSITGRPAWCGLYHTIPPADCCDALLVWVERIEPTEVFPNPFGGALKCGTVVPMASIAMRLYRPCWPTVKDTANPLSGLYQEAELATVDLQIDAVSLFCCLMSDLSSPDSVIKAGGCDLATMGAMTPEPPRSGCVAWTVRFKLELPGCCSMLGPA